MKYSHAPDPGFMVPENGRDFIWSSHARHAGHF